jgi:hypothetical protein
MNKIIIALVFSSSMVLTADFVKQSKDLALSVKTSAYDASRKYFTVPISLGFSSSDKKAAATVDLIASTTIKSTFVGLKTSQPSSSDFEQFGVKSCTSDDGCEVDTKKDLKADYNGQSFNYNPGKDILNLFGQKKKEDMPEMAVNFVKDGKAPDAQVIGLAPSSDFWNEVAAKYATSDDTAAFLTISLADDDKVTQDMLKGTSGSFSKAKFTIGADKVDTVLKAGDDTVIVDNADDQGWNIPSVNCIVGKGKGHEGGACIALEENSVISFSNEEAKSHVESALNKAICPDDKGKACTKDIKSLSALPDVTLEFKQVASSGSSSSKETLMDKKEVTIKVTFKPEEYAFIKDKRPTYSFKVVGDAKAGCKTDTNYFLGAIALAKLDLTLVRGQVTPKYRMAIKVKTGANDDDDDGTSIWIYILIIVIVLIVLIAIAVGVFLFIRSRSETDYDRA